jgi:hypothetical protein
MEKKTKEVPAMLTVKRQYNKTPETTKDEVIEIHSFVTAPATVGVEMGLTINIGNFESCRVSVSVSAPCYKEEVDAAYEWAKDFVEARVKAEAADVNSQKKNSPF